MKGLLVSLITFVAYVLVTMVYCHFRRPKRHAMAFAGLFALILPFYFLLFYLTPPDFWILPESWLAENAVLDLAYGFAVLGLNAHSFVDVFFGLNTGFSTSLLLEIARAQQGLATDALAARFQGSEGSEKVYSWRLPRLAETGYLKPENGAYVLTPKGRLAARIAHLFKKLFNLGLGG